MENKLMKKISREDIFKGMSVGLLVFLAMVIVSQHINQLNSNNNSAIQLGIIEDQLQSKSDSIDELQKRVIEYDTVIQAQKRQISLDSSLIYQLKSNTNEKLRHIHTMGVDELLELFSDSKTR